MVTQMFIPYMSWGEFQHQQNFQSNLYEHIWTDVKINETIFAISAFYRPPNESNADHQQFLQFAENTLSSKIKSYCI